MVEERSEANGSVRVLVVGGQSRAAQAFRECVSKKGIFSPSVLVRKSACELPGERIETIQDYFDPGSDLLQSTDVVINFVGLTGRRRDAELRSINVEGPIRLAQSAKRQGVRHFVHLSSLAVYGSAKDINADTPDAPITPYGHSKREADKELAELADPGFVVTILRAPTLYGPGQPGKLGQLASTMSRLGWFPVGQYLQLRSTLHLRNLAAALIEAVQRRLRGIQFAADPQPFALDILAQVIGEHRGRNIRLLRLPALAFLPMRVLAPGFHASVYGRSLIQEEACVTPPSGYPLSLRAGLKDLLR